MVPVITGLGIVSPIGVGAATFWRAAMRGDSGIGTVGRFCVDSLPVSCRIAGEVKDFDATRWLTPAMVAHSSRYSQLAIAAATMALEDSRCDLASVRPAEVVVAIGTSLSGIPDIGEAGAAAFQRGEDVPAWTLLDASTHAATSYIGIKFGAQGETVSPASACAAGIDAVTWGVERVQSGAAKIAIAGGADAPLSPFIMTAFDRLGVLSRWGGPPREASRPFDKYRSGMVLAEGAAVVVIENEWEALRRGAKIYARILSGAGGSEAEHIKRLKLDGTCVSVTVTRALKKAKLSTRDIDYVCAHGNSMVDYDIAETRGLKSAFGNYAYSVPVSSIKSMCGQALAAAGAMQIVTACLSIASKEIPPTINYTERDEECDLDYVANVGRKARVNNVVVHVQSLGGRHTVIVLGAP